VFGLLLFTFRTLLHTFNFRGSSRHSAIHSLTALSCAKVSPRSATSDEHGSDEPAIEETPEDLPNTPLSNPARVCSSRDRTPVHLKDEAEKQSWTADLARYDVGSLAAA